MKCRDTHKNAIECIEETHSRYWWLDEAYVRAQEEDKPVKRMGNMRISQILVPLAPWIDAIPSRATSDDVSKPSPNTMPSGYIFHGLRQDGQQVLIPLFQEQRKLGLD